LALRRSNGAAPFTVLSCDNLPDNGALTRRVVLEFARQLDPSLAIWIDQEARFPATMVDRITPATTKADIAKLEDLTGYHDPACVMHEPFRQWVIEDGFVGGDRPNWNNAGAQFVQNVAGFETMKLRCLNGTHSALAYLGYLAGFETISETVADPGFSKLLDRLWTQEIIPTVPQPEGEDLLAYCASLKVRYLNPAIAHRTWQIAMDGSQKLPQRLLGTIADNLAAGRSIAGLALAVAAWMRYVSGVDDAGDPIDVRDPMAEVLRTASDAGKAEALLDIPQVFDPEVASDPVFRKAVFAAYQDLTDKGARAVVQSFST
jgi:fructuronate reductase